jgi:hypothetical protein
MPFYKVQDSIHWLDSSNDINHLPDGALEVTEEEANALRKKEITLRDYDIAVEIELDREAREAGYYDPLDRIPPIDRACSYAGFTNDYQAEAQTFVAWRSDVWGYVYAVKSDVEAGSREQPTIEELIAELPLRT